MSTGCGSCPCETARPHTSEPIDPPVILEADGLAEAIRELPHLLAHLRRFMPGFHNARLARVAPELYIRETRHIHGHYAIKVSDIRAERQFFDRVALVSYPLDLHPYKKGDINPFGPRRYYYTLPLRSLVPRKVDGLFVASRSLSATYSAAGSARVIPITMAAGEAAGAGRGAIGRGAGFAPVCRDEGETLFPVAGEDVGTAGDVAGAAGEDCGAGASAEPRARTSAATSEIPDIITGRSASGTTSPVCSCEAGICAPSAT